MRRSVDAATDVAGNGRTGPGHNAGASATHPRKGSSMGYSTKHLRRSWDARASATHPRKSSRMGYEAPASAVHPRKSSGMSHDGGGASGMHTAVSSPGSARALHNGPADGSPGDGATGASHGSLFSKKLLHAVGAGSQYGTDADAVERFEHDKRRLHSMWDEFAIEPAEVRPFVLHHFDSPTPTNQWAIQEEIKRLLVLRHVQQSLLCCIDAREQILCDIHGLVDRYDAAQAKREDLLSELLQLLVDLRAATLICIDALDRWRFSADEVWPAGCSTAQWCVTVEPAPPGGSAPPHKGPGGPPTDH